MKPGDKVEILLHGRARGVRDEGGGWMHYWLTGEIVKINRKTVDVQIRPNWTERYVKIDRVREVSA